MGPTKSVRRFVLALIGLLGVLGVLGAAVLAAPVKADYSLGVSPASQSIPRGQTAKYTVTVSASGGFTGAVALTVSGLPTGATASLSPTSSSLTSTTTSFTSLLSVTTTASAPAGMSTFTITGTSGSTKRSVTASLTVNPVLTSTFSLAASPASVSVAPGSTAVYTINLTRTAPFAGAVTLAAYGGWPVGTAATFNPNPIPSTGNSSALQVSTTRGSTPDGTYKLSLVGSYRDPSSGQTSSQYLQAQLIVDSKLSSKPFTVSGGSPTRSLAPGIPNQALNLALTNPNNQTLPITNLSVTVTGTSAGNACTPSNFAVTQYSGPYPLNVPAHAQNLTLSALGIPVSQQPQLRMLDLPVNQDSCKGVAISLAYSGSAQGN